MPDRLEAEEVLFAALAQVGLEHYTDGVMDSLDMVIEWDDEEDDDDEQ